MRRAAHWPLTLERGRLLAGQVASPILANYGDGFATDSALPTGYSTPILLFNALLAKPYLQQVVLAPHLYGPSVTRELLQAAGPLHGTQAACLGWHDSADPSAPWSP